MRRSRCLQPWLAAAALAAPSMTDGEPQRIAAQAWEMGVVALELVSSVPVPPVVALLAAGLALGLARGGSGLRGVRRPVRRRRD